MLESIVDLLDGLFLIAVMLLMVLGVVGSIVAALRAVGRENAISTSSQGKFIDDVSERSIGLHVGNVVTNPNPISSIASTALTRRPEDDAARVPASASTQLSGFGIPRRR
jgi:hypothetical protein